MARQEMISEAVRAAVTASGKAQAKVAQEVGISESQMSRFMTGKSAISMEVMDKLGLLLRLSVRRG